jgi:hypothetical protein
MGNSPTTLYTYVHNQDVVAGSPLLGKVYLDVRTSTGVTADTLTIRVTGRVVTEVAYMEATPSMNRSSVVEKVARNENLFMDVQLQVTRFENWHLDKGQYEYPFSLVIPEGVPSSLSISTGFRDRCMIEYHIEAQLLHSTGTVLHQHRRALIVTNSIPTSSPVAQYIEGESTPMHLYACAKRGHVRLCGSIGPSVCTPTAETTVKFTIAKKPALPVSEVKISLKEHVTFHAGGKHSQPLVTLLYARRVSRGDAMLTTAFVPAAKKAAGADGITAELRALGHSLATEVCAVRFSVPSTAHSSFSGANITVQHVLTIQATIPSGTPEIVTIRTDVLVRTTHIDSLSPVIAQTYVAVPVGWKAEVAPVVVLPAFRIRRAPPDETGSVANTPRAAGTPVLENAQQRAFRQLLDSVHVSYTPCYELVLWLRAGNSLRDMQDEQAQALFRAVPSAVDQAQLAGIVAAALSTVSCRLVAKVASVCAESCRREICEKLLTAGLITDKAENAPLLAAHLTAFQFMTVERYLS